jgi:outer membrane lipoprotein SlyB
MEAPVARQAHPFVMIAAIAVTVFSLVGIGAVLGWIPTTIGGGGVTPAAPAPAQPKAEVPGPLAQAPAQPVVQSPAPVDALKPAAPKVVKQAKPHPKPVVASPEPPQQVIREVAPPPPPPVVAAICRECAVIEDVREVEKAGQASGVGAVGGAVVGGVLGHQVGSGRGKDIATVIGAIGGGVAGHQIEKTVKKTKEYQITVRYEDGTKGMFTQDTPPSWRPGDKVKIINGAIQGRG